MSFCQSGGLDPLEIIDSAITTNRGVSYWELFFVVDGYASIIDEGNAEKVALHFEAHAMELENA